MPMTQVPSYIGDDAFKAFLSEHGCRTSFEEIRMRFLGAMVSPEREADIYPLVEDLFEHDMPELPDGSALEAFLHTFLGLWNVVADSSRQSPITLSPVGSVTTRGEIKDLLYRRIDEVVFGFGLVRNGISTFAVVVAELAGPNGGRAGRHRWPRFKNWVGVGRSLRELPLG